ITDQNLDTAEGRLAALDAAAPIVGRIKERGLRQLYPVNLDRWLGMMKEQFVLDRIRDHGGRGTAAVTGSAGGPRSGTGFGRADSPPSAQRGGRNETPGNGTASQ